MKSYPTNKLRNISLISHGGAGKTSLVESVLFKAALTTRLGKVEDGNTVSDYLPEEIKRSVSINTSLVPCLWQDYKINFLDTPGYGDFVGEVKGALRAADAGLIVVCGVAGVEVQTEAVWDYLDELNLPRMVFVNKMDRENANFHQAYEMLRESYGNKILPVQLPIGSGEDYSGIVDLLSLKAYSFNGKGDSVATELPVHIQDQAELYREAMIESIAECDDELLIQYLDGTTLSFDQLKQGLKKGLAENKIVPVLCGSAIKGIGIDLLIQSLIDFAPEPIVEDDDKLKALVFKTMADPYVGRLNFFRVFSGKMQSDSLIYNVSKNADEKIGQIFSMTGKNQQPMQFIGAGDIGAVAKLQLTGTGDTLGHKDIIDSFEKISYPNPTFSVAVFPKSKGDEDKLGSAINRLLEEDPTLRFAKNVETKESILTGIGEMHLDIVVERLQRKFAVEVATYTPKIPYRETIKSSIKVEGKHKKQSGGHGQYGHVWIEFTPYPEGDFYFNETIFGGAVPKQYIPAVEKGLREAMQEGVLAGYPTTNIKATLYDGSFHPVDSSEMAFKIAASLAFRKGVDKANPVLLEPVMEVGISVPETFMGDIMGDVNSKRGRILGMESHGKTQEIKALIPLAELSRYAIELKAMTQGRGTFSMTFGQYEEVPHKIAETIISQLQAKSS